MAHTARKTSELEQIPGVGPRLADLLEQIGHHRVADLRHQDPEAMFATLCERRGVPVDRCVLYVFRCAVYFASQTDPDPERLKWWNWTDERTASQPVQARGQGRHD